MDEPNLPRMLSSLDDQTCLPEAVFVCINQPAAYYGDGSSEHARVCEVNEAAFRQLERMVAGNRFSFPVVLIDRYSPGRAWDAKHYGVGWARKTAMDAALEYARSRRWPLERVLLACMDADTLYPEDYLECQAALFAACPEALALSNPYYHFLEEGLAGAKLLGWKAGTVVAGNVPSGMFPQETVLEGISSSGPAHAGLSDSVPDCSLDVNGAGSDSEKRACAMLHYEVYMRSYALNLMLVGHPYALTAVGSSMSCTLEAYRKIGGISPFKSGEDFYFLQKMLKTGAVLRHSPALSHPSPRLSTRVFFGTGPALNKGLEGQWASYPIYPMSLFGRMQDAYEALPDLYDLLCRGIAEEKLWDGGLPAAGDFPAGKPLLGRFPVGDVCGEPKAADGARQRAAEAGCPDCLPAVGLNATGGNAALWKKFDFWGAAFGSDWWKPIKAHCGGRKAQFVRACMEKFDALRSLQFLKASYVQDDRRDWLNLRELCHELWGRLGLDRVSVEVFEADDRQLTGWSACRQQRLAALTGIGAVEAGMQGRGLDAGNAGGACVVAPGGRSSLQDLSLEDWESIRDFLFLCERKMQKEQLLLRWS